jgi:hypothetical protein
LQTTHSPALSLCNASKLAREHPSVL